MADNQQFASAMDISEFKERKHQFETEIQALKDGISEFEFKLEKIDPATGAVSPLCTHILESDIGLSDTRYSYNFHYCKNCLPIRYDSYSNKSSDCSDRRCEIGRTNINPSKTSGDCSFDSNLKLTITNKITDNVCFEESLGTLTKCESRKKKDCVPIDTPHIKIIYQSLKDKNRITDVTFKLDKSISPEDHEKKIRLALLQKELNAFESKFSNGVRMVVASQKRKVYDTERTIKSDIKVIAELEEKIKRVKEELLEAHDSHAQNKRKLEEIKGEVPESFASEVNTLRTFVKKQKKKVGF